MSWNGHADYMKNMFSGYAECLLLLGPEGAVWGRSGGDQDFDPSELPKTLQNPIDGLRCAKGKFMFLRDFDDMCAFNKTGKGALMIKGQQYVIVVYAADGVKAEVCTGALQKAKAYMESIGYK